MNDPDVIEKILTLARWAPSGDNNQYWRFERTGAMSIRVHGFDTRKHCVYDLDGHPSQISLGAFLETIDIAASGHGLAADTVFDESSDDTHLKFDLSFTPSAHIEPSPLAAVIEDRHVQRRPFSTRPLASHERQALRDAVAPTHDVYWIEGFGQRLKTALLMFHSAKLRLTIPEAYRVHKKIIHWDAKFSPTAIPDQALGASRLTLMMMRHVMQSWERVQFFNKYLAGTWAPRIELDLVPGLMCAAHFVISAPVPPDSVSDYVAAGRAIQRFWLTATKLGLQLQPEVTPLVFTRYARKLPGFSTEPGSQEQAKSIAQGLQDLVGEDIRARAVFMGRIGQGAKPQAHSIRLELKDLEYDPHNLPE